MLEKDVMDPRGGKVGRATLPNSRRFKFRCGVDSDLPKNGALVNETRSSGSDSRRYGKGDALRLRRFVLRSSSMLECLPSAKPKSEEAEELGTAADRNVTV